MSNRPPVSAVTLGDCVFVSTTGNDGTGLRERLDKPFATLLAGLAAAQPGDTLIVYPGDYVVSAPLPVNKGVAFEFIGNGTVTSTGTIFSDNGATGLYIADITAPGWTFESTSASCVEFSSWGAAKKVHFTFGTIRSDRTCVNVYSGQPTRVVLEGRALLCANGTPLLVSAGNVTVRNCQIETAALGNHDAILLGQGSKVIAEHCTILAGGGVEGTDAIGMDGGELVLRDCSVTSEGADALTLRGSGKAALWGCDITGLATALRVSNTISVEAFASRFTGEIVKSDTGSIAFYGCKTV